MAFNTQEQEIIKWGQANGKSVQEIKNAVFRFRSTGSPADPNNPPTEKNFVEKAASTALGAVKGFTEGTIGTASLLQDVGQGVLAVGQGALDPNKTIGETWKELQTTTGFQSLEGEQKRQIDEMLKAQNPEEKTGKVLGFIGEVLAGGGATVGKQVVQRFARKAGQFGEILKGATQVVTEAGVKVAETPAVSGTVQTVKDVAERVPRFFGRVKEGVEEAAVRAEKIRTSPPAVSQALKVELPDKYINFAQEIDEPTRKAVIRVLDIADETPKTVGVKTNPTIVGGELAGKQYDVIEKQRKNIGAQIGEQVDALTKSNIKANMGVSFKQIDDVLVENGIQIGEKGVLKFVGKYTDAERKRIQELYTLAREGGENLSARQVYDFDQLFSKLQREVRMEGIGDLRVTANGESMSLFRVFRDVFSNQLEQIAPAIKPLNRQYRDLVTLIDDIEDSIIKTPNFNITKSTDPAEFAKVNLRRIFGEAQSSPAYEAVADEMDTFARALGYDDASPKDVAAFAQEIRELYKEAVPRTGFAGSLQGVVETVMKVGEPNVKDQQKALRALLESLKQNK